MKVDRILDVVEYGLWASGLCVVGIAIHLFGFLIPERRRELDRARRTDWEDPKWWP